MKQKYCIPIIKDKSKDLIDILVKNKKSYDFFEIWLDYIEDLNIEIIKTLINEFDGRLIFLFRRQNLENSKMNSKNKIEIMKLIEKSKCFLDLDISQDEELKYLSLNLEKIKLIISYHNYKETPSIETLEKIILDMDKYNPEIYKLATFCNKYKDAQQVIDLTFFLKERNCKFIVLGMGDQGVITRIAGAILGNEINFAPVSDKEKSAKGQLTKSNLEEILKKIKICYFIGDPVNHSLSPNMHNSGYKALGIDKKFIYLRKLANSKNLKLCIEEIKKSSNFVGASVSIPHKVEIMKYIDEVDQIAKIIGAVNTIVKKGNKILGINTDYIGILKPLKKILTLKGKTAAVLGAGGAARASVYALTTEGVRVTIFNRSLENAKKLAKDFKSNFYSFSEIEKISQFDIVINATSIGLDETDSPLFPKNLIRSNQVIFDVVYSKNNRQTKLIKNAKEKKAKIITGLEMLVYQGVEQFKIFTKRNISPEIMRRAI